MIGAGFYSEDMLASRPLGYICYRWVVWSNLFGRCSILLRKLLDAPKNAFCIESKGHLNLAHSNVLTLIIPPTWRPVYNTHFNGVIAARAYLYIADSSCWTSKLQLIVIVMPFYRSVFWIRR